MLFSSVGRVYFPGYELKLCCIRNVNSLSNDCLNERYRIVSVKAGSGIYTNGDSSQIVTSPSVLCLNELDRIDLHSTSELKLDIMYFDPTCFERYKTFESLQIWKDNLNNDAWFFRPFFERTNSYLGACAANRFTLNRVSQLIELTDKELTVQRDEFWPCRSRSFFLELLLLANSIYDEHSAQDNTCFGKMSDEVKEVVDWLHIHYPEKITLETVTRQFHTNKTTLNQKFKAVMGVTVSEYTNSIRVQVACSFLRKTELPIKDIMERVGYKDDANFLRSFKKNIGCPPSEYRSRYEAL